MENFSVNTHSVLNLPLEMQIGTGIVVLVGGVLIASSIIERKYAKKGMLVQAEKVNNITHTLVPSIIGVSVVYLFIEAFGAFL
ncbi:hypothetical protein Q9251_03125 [Alkalihalobacillus macyae]|uniref:hypothetical protein n=1 Tax=Guptibacillus hwajinpoensis TaxID=208199 RepID=UPI00273BE965|nr:hypothetical protein [Alkalihalobacillus macyae]MDP4549868.1 hypothetical protein [Alkalihalobacillus macyae]